MSTNRHLKVIPDTPEIGASRSSFAEWRDIALMSAIVAVLLVSIAGGALSPQPDAGPQAVAQPDQEPGMQAQEAFVYFPSQYANQATGIEEPIPTF